MTARKQERFETRAVLAAICRIADRKLAALEASTPGEARERLLNDIEVIEFFLTPGVLEQAAAKA